ncbi:MAG: prolyl-tRNA synthetase associated domain-containing protein [Clostridiales bacterium]|uniref:prolyl-tRNA synthetase associated domain-containing protein n=1 Tax=Terrisporobacter sp. TaxID=1965305 RepID=UPI002A40B502|nr:prolyl-tRNA synthetase associated domain-containing protein [Terrisporobacter sp.]MCI5629267.1 prolyl-tRNA synthetase associated domain-containing protein [Clostridium sp.]MDD5878826.1 prolyl-tRNA synthetase associated domain-containing protein [Clostridiales bacterium]MCI6456331.1 prolyl-tRNA synthetase associated domain-containing protein [Clostridium sp.]MCI7207341.1 prolyl-tRNA synthetase associated domain-containing protein [Clostridium sp.]MDD7753743.1 prolyl-tRNA synthetase associate
MIDIYEVLNKLNIEYQMVEHEEVFTAEQSKHIKNMIEGVGGKTLFLKDKNNYYLYLLDDERQANLKFLSKSLNIGRLSFGNEDELYDKLKLKKGSVTPLGIINDNSSVILIIDKTLKGKKILTHPNINTATVSIRYDDLIKFIKYCNNTYYEV